MRRLRLRRVVVRVVAGVCAAVAGCSSVPAPIEQFVVARMAIRDAVDAGAAEGAAADLARARQKLARARELSARKENVQARRLAEEAEVDARLAAAKARHARAQRELSDLRQNTGAAGAPAIALPVRTE